MSVNRRTDLPRPLFSLHVYSVLPSHESIRISTWPIGHRCTNRPTRPLHDPYVQRHSSQEGPTRTHTRRRVGKSPRRIVGRSGDGLGTVELRRTSTSKSIGTPLFSDKRKTDKMSSWNRHGFWSCEETEGNGLVQVGVPLCVSCRR